MSSSQPIVFLWGESQQEKSLVAASASSDSLAIYYAVENSCSRHSASCTVSSHTWYEPGRRYLVEDVAWD